MAGYDAASEAAVWFDRSEVAKIVLRGPDAAKFLGNLSTNDIKSLPPGGGCPTFFCTPTAKVLFPGWVFRSPRPEAPLELWLESTAGKNAELFKYLDRYLISEAVELDDATQRFAQFHVAGPQSKAIAEHIAGPIPELDDGQQVVRDLDAIPNVAIRRRDWLARVGYDIVVEITYGDAIRERLHAAGATSGSPDDWEALRIDAGLPKHGVDFDESRFVMEVGGASRAVSFAKGCYLGQEPIVMSRDRAGHAPRSFVKLNVDSSGAISAGAKVTIGGEEVGTVTSAAPSPKSDGWIALGYVRWKHREPGTICSIDGRKATIAATALSRL